MTRFRDGLVSLILIFQSIVQHWGFYRNIWDLKIINLNRVTQIYFVHRIIYALALGAVKISVAGMYFRILEGRSFRYALWATQVLNVLVIVSFLISLGFACIPLRAYWAYTYDVTDSVCPDFWDWGGYYMAFNLILDVVLIALPSGYVWRTLMDLKTKIGVIVVFGLGVLFVFVRFLYPLLTTKLATSSTYRSEHPKPLETGHSY